MLRFGKVKLFLTIAALTMFQFGCGGDKGGKGTGAGDGTGGGHGHAHGHSHSHGELKPGPHGGTQTELEFKDKAGTEVHHHLEVVVNHEKKSVTLYVLGEDSKTATPIKPDTPIEINVTKPSVALVPLTAVGEKDGAASEFTATNDVFATDGDFAGTIAVSLDGNIHQPKFKIEDHDHDHDKKDDHKDEKKDDKK
jgi:hypothetical protein